MKLPSYVAGQWQEGSGSGVSVHNAVNGEPVCEVNSDGIDFAAVVRHAREVGGPALRNMTFHDRAAALKAMAKALMEKKEEFYAVSAKTGATRADGEKGAAIDGHAEAPHGAGRGFDVEGRFKLC